MELPKNHITLSSTREMINLSAPLNLLKVDFFSYTRYYLDGTSVCLLTHTDWYSFFLRKEVPGCINVFNLKSGCNLWSELFPEEAVADAKFNFNIDNGIHFTFRDNDYVEAISFASKSEEQKAIGYFIANIDLLEKFINYFKKRAEPLINKAVKNKIIIPEIMRGYEQVKSGFSLDFEQRMKFLCSIGYDKMFNNLTSREYDCLRHLSRGLKTKEVGKFLGISHRTVETHIRNMMEKFNVNSKSKLAEIYWEFGNTDLINTRILGEN